MYSLSRAGGAVLLVLVLAGVLPAQPQTGQDRPEKFLPDGLKALKDPDARVRFTSIELLIKFGPSARFAVPRLHEMLTEDKSLGVRIKAAEALWVIEQTSPRTLLPVLLEGMKQKQTDLRLLAVRVIGKIGVPAKSAIPELREALNDTDLSVKMQAALALGGMGKAAKKVIPDLLALLPSDDLGLLQATVGLALSKIGPEAIPALIAAQKSKKVEIRRGAMYALMLLGAEAREAVGTLTAGLQDSDAAVRGFAARALGQQKGLPENAFAELDRLALKDTDHGVRCDAALARWQATGKVEPLLRAVEPLLTAEDPGLRARAAQVLAEVGTAAFPAAIALRKAVSDKDGRVRAAAIEALGRIGPKGHHERTPGVIDLLLPYLRDKEVDVAVEAALALWRLKQPPEKTRPPFGAKVATEELVKVLSKALDDDLTVTRLRALSALAEMGPGATSARQRVAELVLEVDDSQLRSAAREALAKMAPKQARQP